MHYPRSICRGNQGLLRIYHCQISWQLCWSNSFHKLFWSIKKFIAQSWIKSPETVFSPWPFCKTNTGLGQASSYWASPELHWWSRGWSPLASVGTHSPSGFRKPKRPIACSDTRTWYHLHQEAWNRPYARGRRRSCTLSSALRELVNKLKLYLLRKNHPRRKQRWWS